MSDGNPPPNQPAPKTRQTTFTNGDEIFAAWTSYKKFLNQEQAAQRRRIDALEDVLKALGDFLEREVQARRITKEQG